VWSKKKKGGTKRRKKKGDFEVCMLFYTRKKRGNFGCKFKPFPKQVGCEKEEGWLLKYFSVWGRGGGKTAVNPSWQRGWKKEGQ